MYKSLTSLTIWQKCLHVVPPVLLCFSRICNVLWDHLRQTFQECFEFVTFHYSNCCIFRVKTVRNNSERDRNKSAQHKVKSRYYKWLLLITKNLKKNPTNFLSTHVRICVKDATPVIILAVERKLWAIFLSWVHLWKQQTSWNRRLKTNYFFKFTSKDLRILRDT